VNQAEQQRATGRQDPAQLRPFAALLQTNQSSLEMHALLFAFAVIPQAGGAPCAFWGEKRIGARAWRLLFAALSTIGRCFVIGYFLGHRYDVRAALVTCRAAPADPPDLDRTAISFFFPIRPPTTCWKIPALLKTLSSGSMHRPFMPDQPPTPSRWPACSGVRTPRCSGSAAVFTLVTCVG